MKLKNILTFLFLIFIFIGCSNVEKSEIQKEREMKLDSLNEECDFATVERSFPEDIYICYKTPSRIKDDTPEEITEDTEKSDEETE